MIKHFCDRCGAEVEEWYSAKFEMESRKFPIFGILNETYDVDKGRIY